MIIKPKDPHTQKMAFRKWEKIPKKKRSEIMKTVSDAWVKTLTPKKRNALGKHLTKARRKAKRLRDKKIPR